MTAAFDASGSDAGMASESLSPRAESPGLSQGQHLLAPVDPLQQASGVYITVHGHFYQPPRENPYLGAIARQPGASPFQNWNERIHHECYRPNAFARILNDRGEVMAIVNNFEYLSFNIGPTLMSWMERYDAEVYQRILEADRKSCQRLNGHGNAIAQVYNHIIMPLANQRDKLSQIRWGKADFQARFGREPEGMWLAEAAVDAATLAALVAEGIKFIVLAPSQAQRCRLIPAPTTNGKGAWHEVGGGQIDPTQPYRCFIPGGDRDRDYLDIFFYDGPISRDMGFNDVLSSSQHLAGRLGQAIRGDRKPSQLISVATDGETFGHHKKGTEKALTYALVAEFPKRGWTVTNFAHYLSLNPPTWEVELKPVTAWSCAHGVDRWQDNCGCGGEGSLWHQHWRRPLREALDWLRDQLIQVYVETGENLFLDPWLARDEYIQVFRSRGFSTLPAPGPDPSDPVDAFLARHQNHPLTEQERVDALCLLEMQRHALLMYTSCGWFFEELSRPEGVQILCYAARALELAGEVAGVKLEPEFIQRLALAPSNIDGFKHGAGVYQQLVIPAQVSLQQVAAHYAISSLFTAYPQQHRVYSYLADQLDYQLQRMGPLTLAVGQLQLTSEITRESTHLVFAVLHLGGWDFHCCIQPFAGRRHYTDLKTSLSSALQQGSAARTVLAMAEIFGDPSYGLSDLFAEERHRITSLLAQETLTRLDQLYSQVYRDNYGVLMAFQRDGLTVPRELQVAAEVALSHRLMNSVKGLEQESSEPLQGDPQLISSYLAELEAIAAEANHLGCTLNLIPARETLERLILRLSWQLLQELTPPIVEATVPRLEQLMALEQQLHLNLSLDRTQELYFHALHAQILPQYFPTASGLVPPILTPTELIPPAIAASEVDSAAPPELSLLHLRQILRLGQKLAIDVSTWLDALFEVR